MAPQRTTSRLLSASCCGLHQDMQCIRSRGGNVTPSCCSYWFLNPFRHRHPNFLASESPVAAFKTQSGWSQPLILLWQPATSTQALLVQQNTLQEAFDFRAISFSVAGAGQPATPTPTLSNVCFPAYLRFGAWSSTPCSNSPARKQGPNLLHFSLLKILITMRARSADIG